jgi:xanthine dehydrogenase accessory factor
MNVGEAMREWAERSEALAIATVVETKKSAPQPVGTKMAVSAGGEIAGAVSGGCVESAVVEVAERIIAGAGPQLLTFGIADEEAWDVGLPCGGEITVWVDRYDPAGLQGEFERCKREGVRAALVTVVAGSSALGERTLLSVDGERRGALSDPELDATGFELAREALWTERRALHAFGEASLFVDVAAPAPRLVIVGAVDFAAQLAAVAALLGWRAIVVDPRARFATPERFPAAERVIAAWPREALAQLEPLDQASAVAVLTHDPKLDDAALLAALESEAGYIGAMGSRRAQARRRERLLAAGVAPEQLDRVAAPIGLDLGGTTASETALSIMGEVIAARHGRHGGRLSDTAGPIHATLVGRR